MTTRLAAALAGRYRVERELGQGGMATVYLAHDVKHDRHVALKVLRPELAAVIGADRFLAEIKTTANLQHPHILPLFDSGVVDGTVFYAMPLFRAPAYGRPMFLDRGSTYDATADGQQFVIRQSANDNYAVLVQNWAAKLSTS